MPDDNWPASLHSLPVWKDHEVRDGRRQHPWEYRDLGDEWFEIEWRRHEAQLERADPAGFNWREFVGLSVIGLLVTGLATALTAGAISGLALTIDGTTTRVPSALDFWIGLWAVLFVMYVALAALTEYADSRGRSA